MKFPVYQTEILSRFERTDFSYTEVFRRTTYYSDGTEESIEYRGKTHFVEPITWT